MNSNFRQRSRMQKMYGSLMIGLSVFPAFFGLLSLYTTVLNGFSDRCNPFTLTGSFSVALNNILIGNLTAFLGVLFAGIALRSRRPKTYFAIALACYASSFSVALYIPSTSIVNYTGYIVSALLLLSSVFVFVKK